jgi:hypothetical protein
MVMIILWQQGHTAIYTTFDAYPIWYSVLSVLFVLIIQDTFYYWLLAPSLDALTTGLQMGTQRTSHEFTNFSLYLILLSSFGIFITSHCLTFIGPVVTFAH